MQKKFIIVFILLFVLLVGTACTKDKIDNSQEEINDSQDNQTQENQSPKWNENFEELTLSDLEIGQRISVMGSENSDGSISANQIMIGDGEIDFKNMAGPPPVANNGDDQTDDSQPPSDFNGQRPNFEQMQNMSEEDRAKFMEEMKAQREANGEDRPRGGMGGSVTRLVGEIIDKDDAIITLKLEDGGSKLIFFSDETVVMKFKEDESDEDKSDG